MKYITRKGKGRIYHLANSDQTDTKCKLFNNPIIDPSHFMLNDTKGQARNLCVHCSNAHLGYKNY